MTNTPNMKPAETTTKIEPAVLTPGTNAPHTPAKEPLTPDVSKSALPSGDHKPVEPALKS
jgi:hypothetical protein